MFAKDHSLGVSLESIDTWYLETKLILLSFLAILKASVFLVPLFVIWHIR